MSNEILQGLNDYLSADETFQCALTEAVHRYYHDKCFTNGEGSRPKNTEEYTYISNLHQTLSCLHPNWRFKLKKRLERYHGWEDTTAIIRDAKPKEIINTQVRLFQISNK